MRFKRRITHPEGTIQEQAVSAFRKLYPGVILTAFTQRAMTLIQRVIYKRQGYMAGTPDVIILAARGGYHGLLLEFKSAKGKQSPEQKEFEDMAKWAGYAYHVVNSVQSAVDVMTDYMNMEITTQIRIPLIPKEKTDNGK